MKHRIVKKAELKAKSEELGIPFSNLLAGYVLEELMYLIEDSPFSLFLWLKNSSVFGIEQYRKKNILNLEFVYITDKLAMKKEGIVPGQKLSLKMGYVMLAHILKVDKVPEISWKGRASVKEDIVELEVVGEFEEMTVPIHIRVTELAREGIVPNRKEITLFMQDNRKVPYLEYPVEIILAEQLFAVIKNMELIPEMNAYDMIYQILSREAVDGRHIRDTLFEMCTKEGVALEPERLNQLLSYRSYSYMRKRWEKYLRHRKRKEPTWDEVMQQIENFLPRIWKSLCSDEIFFGDWMPELLRFLD